MHGALPPHPNRDNTARGGEVPDHEAHQDENSQEVGPNTVLQHSGSTQRTSCLLILFTY
jgi:hypothetical protein